MKLKTILILILSAALACGQSNTVNGKGGGITDQSAFRSALGLGTAATTAATAYATAAQGTLATNAVPSSSLSTAGGANKVLQNDGNGNLSLGPYNNDTSPGVPPTEMSSGNISFPNGQGLIFKSPVDGSTIGSSVLRYYHDLWGGENIETWKWRKALILGEAFQFGRNDSNHDAQYLHMTSGAAHSGDTMRRSKAISQATTTWTAGAEVSNAVMQQAVPLDTSGTNSAWCLFSQGTVDGTGAGPAANNASLTAGNVSGTLMVKATNAGAWHPGLHTAFQALPPGATVAWPLSQYHNHQHATLAINANTVLEFEDLLDGMSGTLVITQPATGSTYGITLPSGSKTPSNGLSVITLSTGNSAVDVLEWQKAGTAIYWTITKDFTGVADTDATGFLSRASIADAAIATDVNNLVVSLKSTSAEGGGTLWDKFYALYPMVGGTSLAHSINLKEDAYNITNSGAWTTGVTHSAEGITGDGSTGFGDTNFNFAAVSAKDSASVYVYCRTPVASLNTGGMLFGAEDLTPNRICLEHYSSTAIRYHGFNANNVGLMAQTATSNRRFAINRSSSTAVQSYRDATANSATQTSVGACAYDICRAIPKNADGSSEGHGYQVEDVWADLERTTYQEQWKIGPATTVLLPTAILGLSSAGVRIDVGAQLSEVIAFAADSGIDIQCGTMPAGMLLWPMKVTGVSCAEVIRTSLRYHPDWIAWIDHTTDPPTFEVKPRATATARTIAVTSNSNLQIVKTSDRVPDCVRICYLTVSVDGSSVLRTGAIDKWPLDGEDSGPGVLTTVVELAGLNAQIQKQEVEVIAIPAEGASDADKKAFLKVQFPQIKNIDDTHFEVPFWHVEVVVDPVPDPAIPPVNPNSERLVGTDLVEHLPNKLIRGAIHPWMRKHVGKVSIGLEEVLETALTTPAESKLLAGLPKNPFVIVATNAVNKIYQGLANWAAAEDIPAGIARKYFETLAAGCYYQGQVTIVENDDVGATRFHGCKLHLSGSLSEYATMGAPIHSVAWNLETRETVISFGPNPDYSIQDFLEYLRQLARRPVTWMSGAERTSEAMGDNAGPSAQGDTVDPADVPGIQQIGNPASSASVWPYEVHSIRDDEGTWKCKVKAGYVQSSDPSYGADPVMVESTLTSDDTAELTVSASHVIYCHSTTDENDLPTEHEIVSLTGPPPAAHAQPGDTVGGGASGAVGEYYHKIADFVLVDDVLKVGKVYHIGGSIFHRPGRNDRNLDLEIYGVGTAYFRGGAFVGDEDPEASDPGNLITKVVLGSV